MSSTIQDVAEQIASVISSTVVRVDLGPGNYLAAADILADNFTVPIALVAENGRPVVHADMGGGSTYEFMIWLLLPRADDAGQLRAMELYASPGDGGTNASSIQAALEDTNAGGSVFEAGVVTKIDGPRNVSVNGTPYLARVFTFECDAGSR